MSTKVQPYLNFVHIFPPWLLGSQNVKRWTNDKTHLCVNSHSETSVRKTIRTSENL